MYESVLFIMLNSLLLCLILAGLMSVAFNYGFNKGVDSVIVIKDPEDKKYPPEPIRKAPEIPGWVKEIRRKAEEKRKEKELEIQDEDDEETKVEKIRNKIEQEKVNKFFD